MSYTLYVNDNGTPVLIANLTEVRDRAATSYQNIEVSDSALNITRADGTVQVIDCLPLRVGKAQKLTTPVHISISGDATGTALFDGSASISIDTILSSSGVVAAKYGPATNASPQPGDTFNVPSVTVDSKGRVTAASNVEVTIPHVALSDSVTSEQGAEDHVAASPLAVKTVYDKVLDNESSIAELSSTVNSVIGGSSGTSLPVLESRVSAVESSVERKATASVFGNVKVTDDYTSGNAAADSVAASPIATTRLFEDVLAAVNAAAVVSDSEISEGAAAQLASDIQALTIRTDNLEDMQETVYPLERGGTGRTDGAAQDVRVNSLAGEVSAKVYGQVGRAKPLSNTHLDTVIVDGYYVGGTNSAYHSEEYGYPQTSSGATFLRVISADKFILQILETNAELWRRTSTTSGESWYGWLPSGGTHSGNIAIYISKSGSDKNPGFSAEYPVQTIDRAMRIARGMSIAKTSGFVVFRIGEGDWGDVTFRQLPFTLLLEPYEGTNPTAYSESLPKFGTVYSMGSYIETYGLVADAVHCAYDGVFTIVGGYKRIGALRARVGGLIYLSSQNAATNVLEMHQQSVYTDNLITAYEGGRINAQYLHIKLAENVSCSGYLLQAGPTGTISMYKGRTVFETGAYTFTGKAVQAQPTGVFRTAESDGAMTFFDQVPGNGIDIQNGAIVNGYTVGQAADNAVVHLAGQETITGKKTFTSVEIKSPSSPELTIINTDINTGVNPAQSEYNVVRFEDADGTSLGVLAHQSYNSGGARTYFTCTSRVGGATGSIEILTPADGSAPYSTAPSTLEGATGNAIVTADWLYNRGFGENIPIVSNADANTYFTSGFYWLAATSTNIPSGSNGLLCVYRAGNVIRQVFYRHGTINSNDFNIFTRQFSLTNGEIGTIGDWVQILTDKSSYRVIPGTVIAFAGNPSSAPSGYLLCNGAAVSRTTYAKLFEAIGTTYGAGNGSTTFNLPDLTGRFIQGYDNDFPVGSVKEAGLPNIAGEVVGRGWNSACDPSGAFETSTKLDTMLSGSGAEGGMQIIFKASSSNTIYGASTTVQPPAVTMRFYIKY